MQIAILKNVVPELRVPSELRLVRVHQWLQRIEDFLASSKGIFSLQTFVLGFLLVSLLMQVRHVLADRVEVPGDELLIDHSPMRQPQWIAAACDRVLKRSRVKKHKESRMLGNLHVRFGVGVEVEPLGLHHLIKEMSGGD